MLERNNKLSYEKIFEKIVIENKTLNFREHFVVMLTAINICSYRYFSLDNSLLSKISWVLNILTVAVYYSINNIIPNYFRLIKIYSTQNCLHHIFYNKYTLYQLKFGIVYYYITHFIFCLTIENIDDLKDNVSFWVNTRAITLYLKDIIFNKNTNSTLQNY